MKGEKKVVTVGETYLPQFSIVEPQSEVIDGYQGIPMPPFKDVLDQEEIGAVIHYIKSLR